MPFGLAPPRSLSEAARLVLLETAVAIPVIMFGRLNRGWREALRSAPMKRDVSAELFRIRCTYSAGRFSELVRRSNSSGACRIYREAV